MLAPIEKNRKIADFDDDNSADFVVGSHYGAAPDRITPRRLSKMREEAGSSVDSEPSCAVKMSEKSRDPDASDIRRYRCDRMIDLRLTFRY